MGAKTSLAFSLKKGMASPLYLRKPVKSQQVLISIYILLIRSFRLA